MRDAHGRAAGGGRGGGRVSRTCKIQSKLLYFFFFFLHAVVLKTSTLCLSVFDERRSCLSASSSPFHRQGKIPPDHPLERQLGLSGTRN